MAQYKIEMTVEAHRRESVEKALRKAFGDDTPLYTTEKVTTPESRSARLSEAESHLEDVKSEVEELKSEMESWLESIPENLQQGDKAQAVQEAIDALGEITDALESVDFSSVDFPGMY